MTQRGVSSAELTQRRNAERTFLKSRIAKLDGFTDEERLEFRGEGLE